MQHVGTSFSVAQATQEIIYELKGGVKIVDKTNGIAKVVFSDEEAKEFSQPCYNVFVNSKKVLAPTSANLLFGNSEKITLKFHENLIKITEFDGTNKTTVYANQKSSPFFHTYHTKKTDTFGEFVNYSLYIPKEVSMEEASEKIQALLSCVDCELLVAACNSHGVVAFGKDKKTNEFVLYWANPYESILKQVEFKKSFDKMGKDSIVNSADNFLSLRYLDCANGIFQGLLNYEDEKIYFINNEEAKAIPFQK